MRVDFKIREMRRQCDIGIILPPESKHSPPTVYARSMILCDSSQPIDDRRFTDQSRDLHQSQMRAETI